MYESCLEKIGKDDDSASLVKSVSDPGTLNTFYYMYQLMHCYILPLTAAVETV